MQIKRPPRGAFLFASGEGAWFEPLGSTAREAGGARRAAPRNPPSMRYWGRCRPFYLHPVRGAWFAPARPPAKPVARGALCPVTDRASVCTEKPPAGPSESLPPYDARTPRGRWMARTFRASGVVSVRPRAGTRALMPADVEPVFAGVHSPPLPTGGGIRSPDKAAGRIRGKAPGTSCSDTPPMRPSGIRLLPGPGSGHDGSSSLPAPQALDLRLSRRLAVPMSEILVPVSFGELLDKIAILQIKSERMTDEAKLANVRKELSAL